MSDSIKNKKTKDSSSDEQVVSTSNSSSEKNSARTTISEPPSKYDLYNKANCDLIDLEELPLLEEEQRIKKTPLKTLIDKKEVVCNVRFDSLHKYFKYYEIKFSCKDSKSFMVMPGDYVKILDCGPKDSYIEENKRVEIVSGFIQTFGQEIVMSSYSKYELRELESRLNLNNLLIIPSPNRYMFSKYRAAFEEISQIVKDPKHPKYELVSSLINEEFDPSPRELDMNIKFHLKLNSTQKLAVREALATKLIYLIQGPPGTGKTKTIYEITRQLLNRGNKILFCSSTNLSTDSMARRFLNVKCKSLRLGEKARVEDDIYPMLLCHQIAQNSEYIRLCKKINKKCREDAYDSDEFDDLEDLQADVVNTQAYKLIEEANIIFSTVNGSRPDNFASCLREFKFDYVIIDEGGQVNEVSSWLPILNGSKVIIAGDHKQLPCCVQNPLAFKMGYGKSLLERLFEKVPNNCKKTLLIQYRMNKFINQFTSKMFYGDQLVSDDSIQQRTLKELRSNPEKNYSDPLFDFLSTNAYGNNFEEQEGTSFVNKLEAALVYQKVSFLKKNYNLPKNSIGVITPYSGQVRLIKKILEINKIYDVEVNTVDGFQGREKEVIIMSFVRHNENNQTGFVKDERRINVSITRAKRALIMIGNKTTLMSSHIIRSLFEAEFLRERPCENVNKILEYVSKISRNSDYI